MNESIISPSLRQDLFQDKKDIHIKLDKEVHVALRTLCLQKGITMQDVFCEFARLLVTGDKRASGLTDSFILRKLNLPKRSKQYKRKKMTNLSEPDKESLYDLIGADQQFLKDDSP